VRLSGRFRSFGYDGVLRLEFFNDRLLSTEFVTSDGLAYLRTLARNHTNVPQSPGKTIQTQPGVDFTYYNEQSGVYRFRWEDSRLSAEWLDWVRKYS
jgi:hypothetical protein